MHKGKPLLLLLEVGLKQKTQIKLIVKRQIASVLFPEPFAIFALAETNSFLKTT